MRRKKVLSLLLALVLAVAPLSGLTGISRAEAQPLAFAGKDLLLHYDMKTTEKVNEQLIIKDVAGGSVTYDGVFKNENNGLLVKNSEVGYVSFNGGNSNSNSGYIEIPKGSDGKDLLNGLSEVTVSALVNWENDGTNRWIFGLGTVATPETNKYFFATPNHSNGGVATTGISEKGWPAESLVRGSGRLDAGAWKLVTIVFSDITNTISYYVDGTQIASGSAGGKKLANLINPSAGFSGFIGKSIFTGDPYYKGRVGDFRIYKGALSQAEVTELQTEAAATIAKIHQISLDDAYNSLDVDQYLTGTDTSTSAVTNNLALPATGKNNVGIAWSSSKPAVISNTGAVTRPDVTGTNEQVTLTATLTYQGLTKTKTFTVTVLKTFSHLQVVQADATRLSIPNVDNIKGNIHLETTGLEGSDITWASSHPSIVKGTAEAVADTTQLGRVVRPQADTQVTLTATVKSGDQQVTKPFTLTVKKAAAALDYDAYFFAYFTGEYNGGEEISFATAEDPLKWNALNNGQSIIKSTLGEKGLRDPFIIRSPEGDKFYLLATDLKMGESTNFDDAQINGSHYMMIWESDDLVNWSEQRMVEVAPKKGGNTWAPEAFYDKNTGDYVVFWASSMKVEDTYGKFPNGSPAGQYNVMYYATTRDFYTFSEPKVYIDEGFPTIDTTMLEHNGSIYRFTKSEVGFKVYYEKANNVFYDKDGIAANGYQFDPIAGTRNGNQGTIGHAGNNEGPTVFKDIKQDKWYMFLDSWPYHVRVSNNLDDGSQFKDNLLPDSSYALPPGPRHGTVIPITRAEYNALQAKYALPGPTASAQPVVHYTFDSADVTDKTVKDKSGNGHDAKLVGGATISTTDKVGAGSGALALDGTSGYVELPQNLIQTLNLQKMTVAAWVKDEQGASNQRIFDFSSPTRSVNRNTMYLSTSGDTGSLEFALVTPFTEKFSDDSTKLGSNYKYALRSSKLPAAAWHHVAVTLDGFDAVVYVDGVEKVRSSTFNVEPRMLLETTMNYIGKSRNASHALFGGKIDDFRIYNRALAQTEVATLADEEVPNGPDVPVTGPEKLLHYDFTNIEGGNTVKDLQGKFDGKWVNPGKADWLKSGNIGAISFAGGTTDSYIELPAGILNGVTDVTVSALINWKGTQGAEWLFGLGQNDKKYLYYTPSYNADTTARFGMATDAWRNEVSAKGSKLTANDWKLVTVVMSGTEGKLTYYVDGKLVSSGNVAYTLADIRNTSGISGYIGKSFYNDPYFGGLIADFQLFKGALDANAVAALQQEAQSKNVKSLVLDYSADLLTEADFLGKNTSKDAVTVNLSFPAAGKYGTSIKWESSDPGVISDKGVVLRPTAEAGNSTVTLTATVSDGTRSVTKSFTVTVLKNLTSKATATLDAGLLKVYNVNDVRGNLTLPTKGANGSVITWTSSNPAIITSTGEVARPANGSGDVQVQLTATIQSGSEKLTKAFQATVRELPKQEAYGGYLFTYFTGEGTANGEQIYFALSEGNNALKWNEIGKETNGKKDPLFTSNLGEKGLRDPFIIRSPEGDRFYMIATDLKIYGNGDWDRAQRYGSLSLMVWESTDLINWSNQRMVKVSPDAAGNTWAPEAHYDPATGEYVVFWASKLYDNEAHSGGTHNVMMYAKTRDFYTFSEPEVYIDRGYSLIDTTMINHNDKVYRFTKDERDYNATNSPHGKFVFQEVGNSILDANFKMIKEGIGQGQISAGEGPTIFKSNTEEKWYLFIDEFGGRGYVPFETTDLNSGNWSIPATYSLPSRPRHGTVIPVTTTEHNALTSTLPKIATPTGVAATGVTLNESTVELKTGQQLQLTATVAPANATNKAVLWTSSNNAVATVDATGKITAEQPGSAVISVTTVDGSYLAVAEVTVATPNTPVVLKGDTTAISGLPFRITFGFDGLDESFVAHDITFQYDPNVLEFVSVQSLRKDSFEVAGDKSTTGALRLLTFSVKENSPNGTNLELTFKAKSSAIPGTTLIKVEPIIVSTKLGAEHPINGATHSVEVRAGNLEALRSLITDAQTMHDKAVEGLRIGQYAEGSKAKLQTAINAAKVVANNNASTSDQIAAALTNLNSAFNTFKSSVNRAVTSDYNQDNSLSVGDLGIVASSYGAKKSDSNWEQLKQYDLNNDGEVNILDLVIMAKRIMSWE
ncbi:immunoglobulin-like domain-containing protein [Paenibacillus sp. SYP-B4298]|uniref:immunoglobulin-like domain-containing protein n=1 Tax=Paenibacillus sp. SYP-B4298 TaxID=2996034 RepID=UPI0022DE5571|nr:immunoglobulin-like domain-containing protein [Paenibacillus sp. SYP-B4298]